MRFFSKIKKHRRTTEAYSEEEVIELEKYIKTAFGEFDKVLHEIASPDIHLDIAIIPPSDTSDYYTLVTMGMGAHKMNVPKEMEPFFGYAELIILLPSDWHIESNDEEWYWPIRLLKQLARLAIRNNTWLGFGHTIANEKQFHPSTELCGSLLVSPQSIEEAGMFLNMRDKRVHFYQVLPLYESEMEYKLESDAESLLDKMKGDFPFIINPQRKDRIGEAQGK